MTIKPKLKRVENEALQAIQCLTTARTTDGIGSDNVRALAALFAEVNQRLVRIADDMDEQTHQREQLDYDLGTSLDYSIPITQTGDGDDIP